MENASNIIYSNFLWKLQNLPETAWKGVDYRMCSWFIQSKTMPQDCRLGHLNSLKSRNVLVQSRHCALCIWKKHLGFKGLMAQNSRWFRLNYTYDFFFTYNSRRFLKDTNPLPTNDAIWHQNIAEALLLIESICDRVFRFGRNVPLQLYWKTSIFLFSQCNGFI